MDIIKIFFLLLGSLGVFIYGMKVMSEALQKVAGNKLKEILGKMTTNPVAGVISGFFITSVIQSSSATTVMVVSFVNAELLTLVQSIGIIMGANIGTTVTGWIVALLGFKVKIAHFALPAIGVGFVAGYMKNYKVRQWGNVLIGFGFLFLGLSLLKESVPEISEDSLSFIANLSDYGYFSYVIFVLLGTIFTIILQSSSATMAMTLTFAAAGYIEFDMAAAMILGENIGTTATANIASIGTSTNAKRSARAHFIFNIIGVTWIMAVFPFILPIIDKIVPGNPYDFPRIDADTATIAIFGATIASHLAMFHTIFNVTNTVTLIGFRQKIANIVTKWVPESKSQERVSKFLPTSVHVKNEFMSMPVRRELEHMTSVVKTMYADAIKVITTQSESSEKLIRDTIKREEFIDDLEREITEHLALVTEASPSAKTLFEVTQLLENAHRIERLGDHCEELVNLAQRIQKKGLQLDEEAQEEFATLGQIVQEALDHLSKYLTGEGSREEARSIEKRIDKTLKKMKKCEIKKMRKNGKSGIDVGLIAIDVLSLLEEIGDRAYGIVCNSPIEGPAE